MEPTRQTVRLFRATPTGAQSTSRPQTSCSRLTGETIAQQAKTGCIRRGCLISPPILGRMPMPREALSIRRVQADQTPTLDRSAISIRTPARSAAYFATEAVDSGLYVTTWL